MLFDVASGKAVCRMSQISQPFLSTQILILQLIAQDPVHFVWAKC